MALHHSHSQMFVLWTFIRFFRLGWERTASTVIAGDWMLRAGMLDFINIDSYLGGSAAVPVTKLEEEIRAREDRQREAEHNWEQ